MQARNAREYRAYISEVTNQCLGPHSFKNIIDMSARAGAISCVDHNCEQVGGGAFPGSLWGLDLIRTRENKNMLWYYLDALSSKGLTSITAYTHSFCGMLFTELGLETQLDQQKYANDHNPRISERAIQQHGISVTWAHTRNDGTAKKWMR